MVVEPVVEEVPLEVEVLEEQLEVEAVVVGVLRALEFVPMKSYAGDLEVYATMCSVEALEDVAMRCSALTYQHQELLAALILLQEIRQLQASVQFLHLAYDSLQQYARLTVHDL